MVYMNRIWLMCCVNKINFLDLISNGWHEKDLMLMFYWSVGFLFAILMTWIFLFYSCRSKSELIIISKVSLAV